MKLKQFPEPGHHQVFFGGDIVTFSLEVPPNESGTGWLRTNLNRAPIRRAEVIAAVERGRPRLDRDWHDLPMRCIAPGRFEVAVPVVDTGVFEAKTLFLPEGARDPLWPPGPNVRIKVSPAAYRSSNGIYTAFVRQFGRHPARTPKDAEAIASLEREGYAVIPPSGKFRDLVHHLPFIVQTLGFRIIQLLPIHPIPTTFARMGRFGSPFATLDFMDVDPSLAEFDRKATPLMQFRELVDAAHRLNARVFLDIPVNHTGWASWLQIHHPDWFARNSAQEFQSPGAWGVVWEDLSKLDYRMRELWSYMAEVFLFWCRMGADGFRCDAGYMVPQDVWEYLAAKVRDQYPDTVFFLEGLGGSLTVTEDLLGEAGLDWAYSELFQNYTRDQIETYLRYADEVTRGDGLMIHYAETHDNNRLAAVSPTYSSMRTSLAALVSQHGGFGVTSGVEWFATEKIRVHEANSLNWGAAPNQVERIGALNRVLRCHPAFLEPAEIRPLPAPAGEEVVQLKRTGGGQTVLILANLRTDRRLRASWKKDDFPVPAQGVLDLVTFSPIAARVDGPDIGVDLAPGQVLCLMPATAGTEPALVPPPGPEGPPRAVRDQGVRKKVLELIGAFGNGLDLTPAAMETTGRRLTEDPVGMVREISGRDIAPIAYWGHPEDLERVVPVPPGHCLLFRAEADFEVTLYEGGRALAQERALPAKDGSFSALLAPLRPPAVPTACDVEISIHRETTWRGCGRLLLLPRFREGIVTLVRSADVLPTRSEYMLLSNRAGAMAQVRAAWGQLASQYDAVLAANPHPGVPNDRWVMLRRCRAWVVWRGYSQEISADSLSVYGQVAENAARWAFAVPCGMGRSVKVEVELTLDSARNGAQLTFRRTAGVLDEEIDPSERVDLILRPDLEDRSVHASTRAHMGPEAAWPPAVRPGEAGFVFCPSPDRSLTVRASPGRFQHEPRWEYGVEQAVEAERGLEPRTDLFSPGFFRIPLQGDQPVRLTAFMAFGPAARAVEDVLPEVPRADPLPPRLSLRAALAAALKQCLADRDGGLTLLAGFPWFLDWGRDTLIGVRGFAAAGLHAEAESILRTIARHERDGTLPNMIRGPETSNRDTSDAPLWFVVACADHIQSMGSETLLDADCGGRTVRDVILSIGEHYLEGTPNGIGVDRQSGLVFSPSHFTWMDTNHPAGTPREGYPIEIQALWQATLQFLHRVTGRGDWAALAEQVRQSILAHYVLEEDMGLSDCLHGARGVPAAQAVPDDHRRPNQLLALTLGAVTDRETGTAVLSACQSLLVPGGIRSLADRPVRFPLAISHEGRVLGDPLRPYRGRYTGPEDTSRKPAYHNGTAWTWLYPSYAEALHLLGGETALEEALALLGTAVELANEDCLGHLPEILDGSTPHAQRGCGAQMWAASEFLRVLALLEDRDTLS